MPEPVREIMRAAYGDATAQIFMVSAIIGVVALVAILFIKEEPLRRTVDIVSPAQSPRRLRSVRPAAVRSRRRDRTRRSATGSESPPAGTQPPRAK